MTTTLPINGIVNANSPILTIPELRMQAQRMGIDVSTVLDTRQILYLINKNRVNIPQIATPGLKPPVAITNLTKKIIPPLGTGTFDVNALPLIQKVDNPVVPQTEYATLNVNGLPLKQENILPGAVIIPPAVKPIVIANLAAVKPILAKPVTVKPKRKAVLKAGNRIGKLQYPDFYHEFPWYTTARKYRGLVRRMKSILKAYPIDVLTEKLLDEHGHIVTTYAQVATFIINEIYNLKFDLFPPINWYRLFTHHSTFQDKMEFEFQINALSHTRIYLLYSLMGGPLSQSDVIMKAWLIAHPYIFTEGQLKQFDYLSLYIIMKQAMIPVLPGNDANPTTLIDNYKQHYANLGGLPIVPVIKISIPTPTATPITHMIPTTGPPKPPTIVIPGGRNIMPVVPMMRMAVGTVSPAIHPIVSTGHPTIRPILPIQPIIQTGVIQPPI